MPSYRIRVTLRSPAGQEVTIGREANWPNAKMFRDAFLKAIDKLRIDNDILNIMIYAKTDRGWEPAVSRAEANAIARAHKEEADSAAITAFCEGLDHWTGEDVLNTWAAALDPASTYFASWSDRVRYQKLLPYLAKLKGVRLTG